MGPNATVDYNLTLCPLQSRLQNIYCTIGNPMPESTLSPSQELWIYVASDNKSLVVANKILRTCCS